MGYRSTVEIAMYPLKPEDFAVLQLYVEEQLPDKFEVVEGAHTKVLHLRLEDVKWYPSYEEVQVYIQCFANWEGTFGTPQRFQYEFIRIGEETGDVEQKRSDVDDWRMHVCTTIEHNF